MNYNLFICIVVIFNSCSNIDQKSNYPIALIRSARLYTIDSLAIDPYVTNGKMPDIALDSLILDQTQWEYLIKITDQPLSDIDFALNCFHPDFIVIFYGRVNRYISHVSVSFSCNQLKYEDNSGINILTNDQKENLEIWFSRLNVIKPKKVVF